MSVVHQVSCFGQHSTPCVEGPKLVAGPAFGPPVQSRSLGPGLSSVFDADLSFCREQHYCGSLLSEVPVLTSLSQAAGEEKSMGHPGSPATCSPTSSGDCKCILIVFLEHCCGSRILAMGPDNWFSKLSLGGEGRITPSHSCFLLLSVRPPVCPNKPTYFTQVKICLCFSGQVCNHKCLFLMWLFRNTIGRLQQPFAVSKMEKLLHDSKSLKKK